MFKRKIKEKNRTCNTKEDFLEIREELKRFGIANFIWDMENLKIFSNGIINKKNNPFAKLIEKYDNDIRKKRDFTNNEDYIMVSSIYDEKHKLLIPKSFDWETFNVLTLSKKHIPMLQKMKEIAIEYVTKQKYKEYFLCFHCYPFNSVHTLHLHIVNCELEPYFLSKNNNLSLDIVLECLEELESLEEL